MYKVFPVDHHPASHIKLADMQVYLFDQAATATTAAAAAT